MSRGVIAAMTAIALASSVRVSVWKYDSPTYTGSDPYKPRPRSKGEKARNKRFRK